MVGVGQYPYKLRFFPLHEPCIIKLVFANKTVTGSESTISNPPSLHKLKNLQKFKTDRPSGSREISGRGDTILHICTASMQTKSTKTLAHWTKLLLFMFH